MSDVVPFGESPRTMEPERDAAEALRLRAAGLDYRAIGVAVGCSVSTAHARVRKAMTMVVYEHVEEVRAVELERLDVLTRRCLGLVNDPDPGVALAAVAACLRVSERRAKLLGLDQPTAVAVQATITIEDVERKLDALLNAGYASDGRARQPSRGVITPE